jgi:sugar phosphate isomerase/epimerase
VEYIGKAPYALDEDYTITDNFKVKIPDNFSWNRVWGVLVESCRFTAEVAARYGRTVIMEPRVGEIVCSVDSMLRLIDDVNMDNFKANFDTGHFSAQRENIPLALKKLEVKFANIHIADNDPVNTSHLPVGTGKTDWYEFFRVLKSMNYNGYLGLDLSSSDAIIEDLKQAVEYISKVAKALEVDVEW